MKPKDYINKKAQEEALKAFGATQLNSTQEAGTYFVGKINASRTKITDPATKKEYDLTFTGNPREYELAQRLSNNTAYVDARKNKMINVDGSTADLRFVGMPVDSSSRKFIYVYSNLRKKLYSIPMTVLGLSDLFGLPISEIPKEPAQIEVTTIPIQAVIFVNNDRDLFIYSVITNLNELSNNPLSSAGSDNPFEISWSLIKNITLSNILAEDDTENTSYIITYSEVERGSYIARISDFNGIGVIATAQADPPPPSYSLLTTSPNISNYSFFMGMRNLAGFSIGIYPHVTYEDGEVYVLIGTASLNDLNSRTYGAPSPSGGTFYVPSELGCSGSAYAENFFVVTVSSGQISLLNSYSIQYNVTWNVTTNVDPGPPETTNIITTSVQNFIFDGIPFNIAQRVDPIIDGAVNGEVQRLNVITPYFSVVGGKVILSRTYEYTQDSNLIQKTEDYIFPLNSSSPLYSSTPLEWLPNSTSPLANFLSEDAIFAMSDKYVYTYGIFGTEKPNPNFGYIKTTNDGGFFCFFADSTDSQGILYKVTPVNTNSQEDLVFLTSPNQVNIRLQKVPRTGVYNFAIAGIGVLDAGTDIKNIEENTLFTEYFITLAAGQSRNIGKSIYGSYSYR